MSGSAVRTPIVVVGMSCRLPGAEGLDEYWTLLTESRDAVVEFPPHRLNRDLYYDGRKGQRGKTYSTIGGLITERPPRVGDESYDVCHRHFADVALEACQHSGIEPAELASRQVGVFVGHSGGSGEFSDIGLGTMAAQAYDPLRSVPALQDMAQDRREGIITQAVERLRRNRRKRTPDGGPKTEARWAAELVARTLDPKGPNLVVDAACSSSLVALALGALALEREEIDVAIVGGASYAQANSLILFSQAQSCSARGSRPFDEEADGLVGSEGYVAVVLKTEARARRDGDSILAVIRGLGLSTDGRGRHLWAPQKEGQTAAIERAYGSEIDPASVQYIEAHATSTQVGDATEIESMVEFFQPHLDGQKIPIGSVKSNIGHTLETAGLASLIKVILAMQHRTIPPTINISKLNDTIDWDSIPFSVARSIEPWARPEGNVRRGAVSAFGIGGLNVHLVVEEPRREAPRDAYLPAPSREPIAIVGRGLIVPGAHDLDAFRSFLKEGISALIEAPESRWPGHIGVDAEGGPWSSPTCLGGFVTDYEYDYVAHRVPPKQVAAANPLQFMLLDATEQALNEAGVVDRKHTSVVVSTVFGGEFANQLLLGMRFPEVRRNLEDVLRSEGLADEQCISIADTFERLFIQAHPATLDETGSFTSSTLASRITKAFDLQGGALAMEAGESSSLVALGTACALLRGNVCSAVVCAGAQRGLDLPSYEAMRLKGGFTQPEFFPGEGVGALVLKRLQDARRDGNAVFGILLGDACSYGADGAGAATAMSARRALEVAGLEQGQVATVEPGGGTAEMCEAQASGLSTIYSTTSNPSLPTYVRHGARKELE